MERVQPRTSAFLPGLRRARARAKLTQEEIAGRAGLERATISNLENLKHRAQALTIERLADALGVEPEELTATPKAEAPLFSDRTPDERRVDYLTAWVDLIESRERRLREAMEDGTVSLETVQRTDELHRDIWTTAAPRIGLLREIGRMPMEEAAVHDRLATALDDLRSTVDEGYDAAIRKLRDHKAGLEDIDRLRGARNESGGQTKNEQKAKSA